MSEIPRNRVFIAVGGCSEPALCVEDGYFIAKATHNSFDYTAAIEFLKLRLEFPQHVFFLHDTMELTQESDRLISGADPNAFATCASTLSGGGQCGLMLWRRDYLESCRVLLESMKNCTKQSAIVTEGLLYKECPHKHRAIYPNEGYAVLGKSARFGGVERIIEYYGAVGIRKFKANWGQNNLHGIVTP